MGKVIFGVASSLDNYIAWRDARFGWIMWSNEVAGLRPRIDAILVGRKTYEVQQQMPPDEDMGMPTVTTHVFSHTHDIAAERWATRIPRTFSYL